MKLKNINIALISVFATIALLSCTAPIDINTRNSEPVIVIYGQITDENKHQYIRITSSSPYFDKKTNAVVSDAKVVITSSQGIEYPFVYEKDGYYKSENSFFGVPNITYNLTVEVDFDKDNEMEIYEASTTLLPVVSVDSADVKLLSIMGYRHFALNFYMQDPPETNNYYLCRFFINDSVSNSMLSEYIITEDRMYNGEYIDGATITYFEDATDEKNLTAPGADEKNNFMMSPGDIIRLQFSNIEKGYYNFINQCISEKYGENPFFGGPPSNITTNLSNGAVGYFTGFCIHEKTAIAP